MEWLFRRHFWIVQLAFVALVAIILAIASNKVIEYNLMTGGAEPEKKSLAAAPRTTRRDFDVANERNLFKTKREKPEPDTPRGSCDTYWDADETTQRIRLVGTSVFSNPEKSFALIEDQKQPGAGAQAYSLKDCRGSSRDFGRPAGGDVEPREPSEACSQIPGVGEIKRIDAECVYFYNESSRRCEFMRLNNSDACNPEAAPVRKSQVAPEVLLAPTPDEPGKTVKKLGPTSFEVDRGDLDNILSNLGQILTSARAVPDTVDGKPALRFVFMQPNSLFKKIGFEIGDVITKINGYEVSIEKATQFFEKLKTDSQFNVEGKRGGSNFTFEYNVKR